VVAVTLANGAKLSPRVLALVEDAASAAGIPSGRCTVVKGSFVPADAVSGSTHAGDGAADIRTINLSPQWTLTLVNELRRRNCAAWLRDAQHGGFARDVAALQLHARVAALGGGGPPPPPPPLLLGPEGGGPSRPPKITRISAFDSQRRAL